MTKIYKFALDKEHLKSFDVKERSFIFSISHLANEITALYRLLIWTTTSRSKVEAEISGQTTYQFMFIRYLAGRLNEGNVLLTKSFYNTKLSKEYYPKLRENGQKALEDINKYFSKENLIHNIRNYFSFHYSPEKLDSAFEDAPDSLDFFLEEGKVVNHLYYFGEIAAGRALLKESGSLKDNLVYEKLIKELLMVSSFFTTAIDEILAVFAGRYYKDMHTDAVEIDFDELPHLLEINIPWFIDISNISEDYK